MEMFNRYIAAAPGTKAPTATPEKQPAGATTPAPVPEPMPQPVPAELADEPGVVVGDLNHKFRVVPNMNNSNKLPIVGRIFASKNNPNNFEIQIGDGYYGPKANNLTAGQLKDTTEQKRRLHLMKFVLDNNLDYNMSINPTPEEQNGARDMFDAYGSEVGSTRIVKAFSLVNRAFSERPKDMADVNPLMLFNNAFTKETGFGLNTYFAQGEPIQRREQLPGVTPFDNLRTTRDKEALALANKAIAGTVASYVPKYESKITGIERRIKSLNEAIIGLRGDNPDIKKYSKEIENLNTERTALISLEAQNFSQWKEEQDNLVRVNSDAQARIASMNATLSNMESTSKANSEKRNVFINRRRTWVGANDGDDVVFNGWIAKGLSNWGAIAPTTSTNFGKVIPMLPGDFLNWAAKNGKYDEFDSKSAEMLLPKPEALDMVIQVTSDQDKLISPLQTLFQRFDEIQDKSALKAIYDKFFDPKYAAQENNVFHIMAARRQFVTGGGNPSNYEQEMLLSGIPNPGKLFSIAGLNKERLKTIAYLTLLDHARTMQKAGFAMTASALQHYNRRYKSILGYDVTAADINRHMHIISTYGLGTKDVGYDPNSASAERAYSHFEQFHQLLQLEDEKRQAGK